MGWDSIERTIYKKAVIDGIEYFEDEIVEIEIDSSITDGSSFAFGTVNSSKCRIKIRTENQIPVNAEVIPSISLDGSNWEQLGVFYIDTRNRIGDFVDLNCFDKLYLAGKQFVTNTNLPMNGRYFENVVGIQEILDDICSVIGISTDIILVTREVDYVYSVPSYTTTMREILGYIAESQGASIAINRSGVLDLVRLSHTVSKRLDKSLHSTVEETNVFKNITQLYINFRMEKYPELSYGIGNEAGETLYTSNMFLEPFADTLNSLIESQLPIQYDPLSMLCRGDPTIKLGDKLEVILRDGRVLNTYCLENKLSIKTGLSQRITAPSDTVQESEFGRFDIIDEIKEIEDRIDDVEEELGPISGNLEIIIDEIGIDPEDEGQTFALTISGNAVEDTDYTLQITDGDVVITPPRDTILWGSHVVIRKLTTEDLYINGEKITNEFDKRISGDVNLNISTDGADYLDLPTIWIESQEPTDEGKDGDIWVVI